MSGTIATAAVMAAAASLASAHMTNRQRGTAPAPLTATQDHAPAQPPHGGEGLLGRAAAAGAAVAAVGATVAALQHDWASDSEEEPETGLVTQRVGCLHSGNNGQIPGTMVNNNVVVDLHLGV